MLTQNVNKFRFLLSKNPCSHCVKRQNNCTKLFRVSSIAQANDANCWKITRWQGQRNCKLDGLLNNCKCSLVYSGGFGNLVGVGRRGIVSTVLTLNKSKEEYQKTFNEIYDKREKIFEEFIKLINEKETPVFFWREELKEKEKLVKGLISRGTHNLTISGKLNELASELSKYNKELEDKVKKKKSLEDAIKDNEKIKGWDNLPKDLQEFLQQKNDELYAELEKVNNQIKEWENKIKELAFELKKYRQSLLEEIEKQKKILEAVIINLQKEEGFEDFAKKHMTGIDIGEKLELALLFQETISKGNDTKGKLAEWKRRMVDRFRKLDELFKVKKELVELEMQLEDTEKVINVFNIKEISGGYNSFGNTISGSASGISINNSPQVVETNVSNGTSHFTASVEISS